jgi:hypothetical protein
MPHQPQPHPLRLAIGLAHSWIELTAQPAPRVVRISAPTLAEAQRRWTGVRRGVPEAAGAQQAPAVLLDVRAHVAASVSAAYAEYRQIDASWVPGGRSAEIVYVGTFSGLASLIWDIWAAGVADGVTLLSDAPERLIEQIAAEIGPRLVAKGARLNADALRAAELSARRSAPHVQAIA